MTDETEQKLAEIQADLADGKIRRGYIEDVSCLQERLAQLRQDIEDLKGQKEYLISEHGERCTELHTAQERVRKLEAENYSLSVSHNTLLVASHELRKKVHRLEERTKESEEVNLRDILAYEAGLEEGRNEARPGAS